MSAGITFSGLATGMDSASIVTQLMQLERMPITRLETRKSTINSQASKLKSFQTKLKALGDAAEKLGERGTSLPLGITSSDEKTASATVSKLARPGSYDLHVDALAMAHKSYTSGVADPKATGIADGTLTLQVGDDDAVDVAITSDDSLEAIVTKINESGADVRASVVFDGTAHRIRVAGNDTGAGRGVTFTETGFDLGFDDAANLSQAAQDASFTFDGLAMTRSTNSFSNAVSGVTIDLKGISADGQSTTLTIAHDDEAQRGTVQAFVDAYNSVMTSLDAEFAYTGASRASSLSGDFTLRSIQTTLRSRVGSTVPGTSGAFTTLASIGIETQRDGKLSLDAAKLDAAMAADSDAVGRLLTGTGSGGTKGFAGLLGDSIESLAGSGGVLKSRVSALEGRSRDIDDQIDRLEDRLDGTETRLRNQFAQLEQAVSGMQAQGNQIMAALIGLTPQSGR